MVPMMHAMQRIPINATGTMMVVNTAMENSSVTGSTSINSRNFHKTSSLFTLEQEHWPCAPAGIAMMGYFPLIPGKDNDEWVKCWKLQSSSEMSSQCLWVLTCEYSPMAAACPRPQMVQLWDCEVTLTSAFLLSLFSCRSEMRWRSKLDIPIVQECLHSKRPWAVVSQVIGSILHSWRLFFKIFVPFYWTTTGMRSRWPDEQSCACLRKASIPVILQRSRTPCLVFCPTTLCQLSASSIWDETCPDCVCDACRWSKSHSCTKCQAEALSSTGKAGGDCASWSESAARAQSSVYRRSRASSSVILDLAASRQRLKIPPSVL